MVITCAAGLLPVFLLSCKVCRSMPQGAASCGVSAMASRSFVRPDCYRERFFTMTAGNSPAVTFTFVLQLLNENNQVIFRYCDANGSTATIHNPNGTTDYIAGICNRERNVFGMMPHPERAADALLGNEDGRLLFESILSMN